MAEKTENNTKATAVDDPPGGHDPAALKDAAKKMGLNS